MVNKLLLLKIFEGFSIQRWNDHARPIELTEMDKSALKLIVAYLLGKMEEKNGIIIDWEKIIYACFFELLKKIALSDIKASIHKKIKNEFPEEFDKLNNWVVDQYEVLIEDNELLKMFRNYLLEKKDLSDINFKIVRAAHKYSTIREFELIKMINSPSIRIFDIEKELNADIQQFLDLKGIQMLVTKQNLYELLSIIEQLRFQVRWGQTQRIPRTTVLGHCMMVSCFTLLFSRELKPKPSKKRLYNNVFCGLFHDLPEAVTRDIISPVKRATDNLPGIVKKIEESIVQEKLFPLIDDSFIEEIRYFTENEFNNRIIIDGEIKTVSAAEIADKYNHDEYSPVDGELIELCDKLSAFLEAYQSKRYGIDSPHLNQGRLNILNKYKNEKNICGIDVRKLFNEFAL
jgi:putative hydrolase of HD superfamily